MVLEGSFWCELPKDAIYWVICLEPVPSMLPGVFSKDYMNISGFSKILTAYSFSNSHYKTISTADKHLSAVYY